MKVAAIVSKLVAVIDMGAILLRFHIQPCSSSNSWDKDIWKLEKTLHTDGEQRTENGEQRTEKQITEAPPFAVLMEHGVEKANNMQVYIWKYECEMPE